MSENNEKRNLNVMPEATTAAPPVQTAKLMNGLSWLLLALLIAALTAVIWMIVDKDNGQATADSGVVAVVNKKEITADDLVNIMSPEEKAGLVDHAVLVTLIEQETDKANITVSEEEIEAAIGLQIAEIKHMFFDEVELESALMMQGLTLEGLKEDMREQPDLIRQLKMEKLFASDIVVTDEDVAQYFEENEQSLNYNKEIQASHILVESEELANDLLQQIEAGADFAELAKEHSTDGSAENGGDLGRFGRGRMVEPFENAAFSLEVNEVSDVVQSDFGYHIILLTGKQDFYTLENDKEILRNMIFRTEMNPLFTEWIEDIRTTADIDLK